jgi:hypothetical protein
MATRQETLLNLNENADNKQYKFVILTDGGGIIPVIKQINYAPDGWKDEITITRNAKYKGVFRSYSTNELKFPKDGRDTLKNIYEALGIAADSTLAVYKWDVENFEFVEHFVGKFDFSTYKIDELFVSIQVVDNSFSERVKNRENVEVNLLVDKTINGMGLAAFSADNTNFAFPSLKITALCKWEGAYSYNMTKPVSGSELWGLQLDLSYYEIDEAETQTHDTLDYFLRNAADDTDVSIFLHLRGRIKLTNYTAYTFKFIIYGASSGNITMYSITINPNVGAWYNFDFNYQAPYSAISAGDNLRLLLWIENPTGAPSGTCYLEINDTYMTMLYEISDLTAIQVTGYPYYEALLRTIQKITNKSNCFYSDYFGRTDSEIITYGSDGQLGHLTKGALVRGLDDGLDINFAVKLEDLFQSLSVLFNLGLGIEDFSGENKVRIEELAYFFDDTVVLDLSARISEDEIGKEVLPKWHYSQIKTGFKKFEYEIKSALFEFNCKQTYATAIDSLSPLENTLDIIAKFRADTNGIIVSRESHIDIVATDKKSEDVKGDDDLFLIDTVRDPLLTSEFRARTDEDFILLSGNISDTDRYNYFYTPKRCMLRHGMNIRAGLEKNLNTYLSFQAVDKSVLLSTQLTAEASPVVEGSDERVNDLTEPMWHAEAYTIECPFFDADLRLLESNMYGLIKLSDTKYGWVLEIKTNVNDKAELKLLRANLDHIIPV